MSGHAPGPWRVGKPSEYGTHCCGLVFGPSEDAVAQVMGLPTNGMVEELPATYAEGIANARLIAAAPELLVALESMLLLHDCGASMAGNVSDVIESARAAIAKATGAQA